MFGDFDGAHADAKSKAISLSKGELDVLHLGNAERIAYVIDVPRRLRKQLAASLTR